MFPSLLGGTGGSHRTRWLAGNGGCAYGGCGASPSEQKREDSPDARCYRHCNEQDCEQSDVVGGLVECLVLGIVDDLVPAPRGIGYDVEIAGDPEARHARSCCLEECGVDMVDEEW